MESYPLFLGTNDMHAAYVPVGIFVGKNKNIPRRKNSGETVFNSRGALVYRKRCL